MRDCDFEDTTGGYGIVMTEVSDSHLHCCTVSHAAGSGIRIENSTRIRCQSCTVHSCGSNGIEFAASTVLSSIHNGCSIHDNGGHGVVFESDTDGCSLHDCEISGHSDGSGIRIGGFGSCVQHNYLRENSSGIVVESSASKTLIANNFSVGNSLEDNGTSTSCIANKE
jgi:hypothetical protein